MLQTSKHAFMLRFTLEIATVFYNALLIEIEVHWSFSWQESGLSSIGAARNATNLGLRQRWENPQRERRRRLRAENER